jgi:hypothetical protein
MRIDTNFFDVTDAFIDAVLDRFKDREVDDLLQVFMRGPFAGWSEGQLYELAKGLDDNRKNYPL